MEEVKKSYSGMIPAENHLQPPGVLRELAEEAGIRVNGDAPWDIQIHDEDVYRRILSKGSLGFGESYMDGQWDCPQLDELFCRLLKFNIDEKLTGWARLRLIGEVLRQRLFNLQSQKRAFQVGDQHYDIGNDVFEAMLDSSMSYSCAYWKDADNLEQAQFNKLDLICRKLELQPGETLLDIGCGWGGLAYHAAKYFGVNIVGITISKEQQKLAQQKCRDLPVNIELMDYRDLRGQYDKVVSVGMFEHVGRKNYPVYFKNVLRLMKDDGLFLLHTIGIFKTVHPVNKWVDKHIFPNYKLPSAEEITKVVNDRFILEDWHSFGADYDKTLMAWWDRFDKAWPTLEGKYGKRFYRMWKYYLLCCAGFFRSRQGQLWQLVLTKRDRENMYHSIR